MKVTITLTESVISLTLSSITFRSHFLLNSLLKPASYQNDGDLFGLHSLILISPPWALLLPLVIQQNLTQKDHINLSLSIITSVLAHRDRHFDPRTLRFRSYLSLLHLNCLINNAIRHNNVHELDVEVTTDDYLNFPCEVIRSYSLHVFKLKSLNL